MLALAVPFSWFILPLAALAVYSLSLNGTPIFDDQDVLYSQTKFRWTRAYLRNCPRVLTGMLYGLQALWPGTFRSLHVGNVLLHAVCGIIVERIAAVHGLDPWLALLTGILYVCHPFAVNSVGYITGRASILSTMWALLAVLAILSGQPWLSFIYIPLAILSKEDAVGYVPLAVILGAIEHQWAFATSMFAAGAIGAFVYRKKLKWWTRRNGGDAMKTIGLPTSYPPREHFATVWVTTLTRLPLWMIGLGTSPYPGSGVAVPTRALIRVTAFSLLALAAAAAIDPPVVALLLVGPWLVYLWCPLPDQIMEYRNYGMVAGMALLTASLLGASMIGWTLVLTAAASVAAVYAFAWSSPLEMWAASTRRAYGDVSRAFQELGAQYKVQGTLQDAEKHLRTAIRLNPNLGPAMNNLGWLLVEAHKPEEGEFWLKTCTERCPNYPLGWEDYGIFQERHGRDPRPFYEKAVALAPEIMVKSINRLGRLDFLAKQFESANNRFDQALALKPNHFEFMYNKAVTLKNWGRLEEGIAWIQKCPQPLPLTDNMISPEFAQ